MRNYNMTFVTSETEISVTIEIRRAWFSNFRHNLRTLWNLTTQDRMCEPYYADNVEDGKWHARGSRRDHSSSSSASLGNFTEAKAWNSSQTHTHTHTHTHQRASAHTSPYQLWSRNAIGGCPLWKVLAVIFKRDFISCTSAFHEQHNELTSSALSQITWDCNAAILYVILNF